MNSDINLDLFLDNPTYTEYNLKNYVFSNILNFESTNMIEFISGSDVDLLRSLKAEPGKDIYLCGGSNLAGFMLENQLIDQLNIKSNPVVLGEGIGLFAESQKKVRLRLFETKSFDNGVLFLSYSIKY